MTPWTAACQAPLSMGFSRPESWSGLPFPSLGDLEWHLSILVQVVALEWLFIMLLQRLGVCRRENRRRQWHPTPVLFPGKAHGQRSLAGCSPWGHKESDTTKQLTLTYVLQTDYLLFFPSVLYSRFSLVTCFIPSTVYIV